LNSERDDVTLFKDKVGFKVNGSLFNQAREEREMDGTSVVSYSRASADLTSITESVVSSIRNIIPSSLPKPSRRKEASAAQVEGEAPRTSSKPLQIKLDPGGARVDFWTEFCSRVPISAIFDVCRQTRGREELTLFEAQQVLSYLRGVQPVHIVNTDPGLKYLIGRREETLQGLLQNCMPSFVNELKGYGSYSQTEQRIPDEIVQSIRKSKKIKKQKKTAQSDHSFLTPMESDSEHYI